MPIRDGFPEQRLVAVPRPLVEAALQQPITRRLVVTDAGYFPQAPDHLVARPEGIGEHVAILCTSGRGWVRFGERRHPVGSGQALVIPATIPHEYGSGAEDPWAIWWVHAAGKDAGELVSAIGPRAHRPTFEIRVVERAVALIDEAVTSLERGASAATLIAASGAVWKLLAQLAVDRILPPPGSPLQRAMAYLEARVESRVRVSELAAMVGVSPSHLTALFGEATGGGVLAYHTELRMARARRLLDTTGLSVSEIAQDSGYGDALYFSRHFRKHHALSPTEYRRREHGGS
ncbi:helix-turn-helix domain-containing protein [Xylanimonas allomyrinae]|uniref:Helix-turn-helix domain-containing protein n=1 Tax=Xylanimonas allomyrinae TaxID=2509459 RepID=A0A4P6EQ19_9MICO|nr:helix-turn-helix domain-containing protein [Xylanimonas allomyrinae]QAY64565.1 helix-turn-helix domain-containing protein [Xylanimonas allomyrinae]